MKTIEIKIAGERFPIKTDGEESDVMSMAKELQERFELFSKNGGPRASAGFRSMTMVAMQLLDELNCEREAHRQSRRDGAAFARQMAGRIDQILSSGGVVE